MNTNDLIVLVSSYANHLGIKQTSVGLYSANDGKFFKRLLNGHTCTISRYEHVKKWFSNNWPDDLKWPIEVIRPKI